MQKAHSRAGGVMANEDEEDQKRLKKRVASARRNMQIEQQKKELMKQLLDNAAYLAVFL